MKNLSSLLNSSFRAILIIPLALGAGLGIASQTQTEGAVPPTENLIPGPGDKLFQFTLSGNQEVPPVDTEASGNCTGILSKDQTTFTIKCNHNVGDPILAHIHKSPPGMDESIIIFSFYSTESPIEQTFRFTPENVASLLAGNLYVNVHSLNFLGGEIRGQITTPVNSSSNGSPLTQAESTASPAEDFTPGPGDKLFKFVLSGDQEVLGPAVNTQASGKCIGILRKDQTTFAITCDHNVENPTVAHIHESPPDMDRNVIIFPFYSAESPIKQIFRFTPEEVASLLAGNLYVNVHSLNFLNGEIRGQITTPVNSSSSGS
jgi:hypothetical protein